MKHKPQTLNPTPWLASPYLFQRLDPQLGGGLTLRFELERVGGGTLQVELPFDVCDAAPLGQVRALGWWRGGFLPFVVEHAILRA